MPEPIIEDLVKTVETASSSHDGRRTGDGTGDGRATDGRAAWWCGGGDDKRRAADERRGGGGCADGTHHAGSASINCRRIAKWPVCVTPFLPVHVPIERSVCFQNESKCLGLSKCLIKGFDEKCFSKCLIKRFDEKCFSKCLIQRFDEKCFSKCLIKRFDAKCFSKCLIKVNEFKINGK